MGTGSLPVPNVQALAADINGFSNNIPERYIRPEAQYDPVSTNGDLEIPIIDMSKLVDQELSSQELTKLHLACMEWGFFQLINHNISKEVIERIKTDISEFFKLSLEKKKEFSQLPGSLEGYGQLFVHSDDQKLDWADMLHFNTQPLKYRSMNIWPANLRDSLAKYSSEVYSLAHVLLGLMAKNLGLNQEVVNNMLHDGLQTVRINYYPPCTRAEKTLGISPHSDGSVLTLLLQVNEVQGLQIKKNGEWISVKPLDAAFVVNIGDTLEVLSNGIYRSIEHRALVNKEKERLSIAAFHNPNSSSAIGPLHDIVRDFNAAKYMTMSYEEYINLFFSSKLNGKSFLENLKK